MHLTTGNFPPPSSRFFPRPKSHDNYFPPICLHRQRDSSILCFIPAAPLATPLVHLHQQPLFSVGTLSPPLQLHQHRQHPNNTTGYGSLAPPSRRLPRLLRRRARAAAVRGGAVPGKRFVPDTTHVVFFPHVYSRIFPLRFFTYLPHVYYYASPARRVASRASGEPSPDRTDRRFLFYVF